MKKTIRLVVLVLGMFLLAGCTKTALNTIAITGNWEHYKTETTLDGVLQQPWYPYVDGTRILYHFDADGSYVRTDEVITNPLLSTNVKGTWLVDGNKMILTHSAGSQVYRIEKAGLLELILVENYDHLGHHYTDVLTFKK